MAKSEYFHYSVEQVTADDLEEALNILQYKDYQIEKIYTLGEEAEDDSEEAVEDVILVVAKRLLGSGPKAKDELLSLMKADGYEPDDEPEDDEDSYEED